MMEIENLLVTNKGQVFQPGRNLIGYQLGVQWQMDYVKDMQAVSFSNIENLVGNFQIGKFRHFLTTRNTLNSLLTQKRIDLSRVEVSVLMKKGVYHYLKPEYQEFMSAFSDYISKNEPFDNFSLITKK